MRARPIAEPPDEHDRALVENVAPPAWVNPTPAGRYNLVVIGAGTAGLVSAIGAAGLGARVALIEHELMGGDCLNVGCVPSKALLRAARARADVRDAAEFGVLVPPGTHVDFPAVMARMRRLRARISRNDSARRYRDLGVDVYLGTGRFTAPDAVEVGGQTLRFAKAVIATGARAAAPEIPGLAEAGYLTNESVFTLTELPRRLAVIGGGPIGCELAQAFARFGAEVWLLQRGDRVLPRDDPDAARHVQRALERDGVRLLLASRIERVEPGGSGPVLHLGVGAEPRTVAVDRVLVGVGRRPNVEGLGLDRAAVAWDARAGVTVDDRLRTSNRRIFAAGDVCSAYRFTHSADFQARIVIQNALFRGRARASALTIPWCTYTDPEVAHVGLGADEARRRGIAIRTFVQPLEEVDRAILDGETEGFVKIHVRDGTDRIVGATIVARHAGEMLPELTAAIAHGLGLGRLARTVHSYPTQADAIRRLGDAYNRTRLTPFVKRLLGGWLRFTR
jgi:pyruvate/2-oxoglutarate dehydrogenase complex dihydrolipoamide dehydrogenase (E3) component